ncbi:hypothetical protein I4U23_015277 [Adineta vaga]|nr:hypothetical protein I4U23_015277 [Adineta vaga]
MLVLQVIICMAKFTTKIPDIEIKYTQFFINNEWHKSILMLALKLDPALACGNVIVLKPTEETPLTALYCAALIKEAGFSPGVNLTVAMLLLFMNVLIKYHLLVLLVGKKIQEDAAKSNLKRVALACRFCCLLCTRSYLSQCRTKLYCASRTFVHSKIYDEFIEKSVALAKMRVVGDPFDDNTQQGPQISKHQFDRILKYIELGKKPGAKLQCGGRKANDQGYFIQPTIFSDAKDDMEIARDEIFGPIMSVLKFDSYDEVIERANATTFGLVAGVITKDLTRALKFVQELQAGSVWVNTYGAMKFQAPFGGFKQYGLEPYYMK